MTADHLSYKRAANVSLIGLSIQTILAVVILIYGVIGADAAAITGALAMLLGLPIWIALALVFHQHRLERLEALENEAFESSSASQISVFEESAAGNRGQAQRLAWMHKWFLPAMSLAVAAAFLAVGAIRFLDTRGQFDEERAFAAPTQSGWAISLGVGVAVLGFIFARFVAGMAKQRVWALLHAGSATAVGAALVGVAIAIAHFVVVAAKNEILIRYLAPLLALFMVALGAEMVLNFILNLYRPRKVGTYQRPAFDSRVLAFIAAPDRLAESISDAINYQFGFNVSSTWFYQLLARSVFSLIALGVLVMWAISIFTVVRPNERGLLLRNGALVREVGPGLVIDYPWPFSTVQRFSASAVNDLRVGTGPPDKEGPILWTNEHTLNEKYLLVQPSGGDGREGDLNLLAVEIPIHYIVTDLKQYKLLAQDGTRDRVDQHRRDLLTAVASSAVIEYMATLSVDDVLGVNRRLMSQSIQQLVQAEFNKLNAGVEVIFAGVAGAHPEQTVAPAFEGVVQADLRSLSAIEVANADAIRRLATVVGDVDRARSIIVELDELDRLRNTKASTEEITLQELKVNDLIASAGGEAAVLISEARADRWRKHMSARSRAVSSQGQILSYRAAPLPYRVGKYIEALQDAAMMSRVWIIPPDHVRIGLNVEEQQAAISAFTSDPPSSN